MLEKRPAPYLLPIIVPRGARIEPSESDMPGYVVQMEWKWIVLVVLAGFGLYALAQEKGPSTAKERGLGVIPKMTKANRLYYMIEKPLPGKRYRGSTFVSIPHSEARAQMKEARKTGTLPLRDIFPLYAKSAEEARGLMDEAQKRGQLYVEPWRPEKGKPKQMELFETSGPLDVSFGGVSGNCMTWQRWFSPHLEQEVWRCESFEPACKPPYCAEKPKTSTARLRVCSDWQKVFSFAYMKDVSRCKEYSPICGTKGCITSPAPKPEGDEPSQAKITAVAKELAKEETEAQAFGPQLAREIKARGGISSYRGGYLKEEYKEIPLHLKRKKGLPLDEMASELGLDEAALIQEIQKAYPKGKKVKRRANWKDFEDKAYRILTGSASLGQYREEALFPGLRREMVLEVEDVSKSDDPVTMCLERKGWKLARIADLRDSIIQKRQPDIFTRETTPLSRSEKELEADTDECFRKASARPTKGPPQQQALFGGFSWFR